MVTSNKPIQKIRLKSLWDDNNLGDNKQFMDIYNKVDISKVGIFSGFKPNISKQYDQFLVKSVIAAMKLRRDTISERQICVREIFVQDDLLDREGTPIFKKSWIQVYPKDLKEQIEKRGGRYSIYTTGEKSSKVILLYGVQYLLDRETNARELQIWRKGVKISDIFPLQQYPQKGQIDLFRTPIMIGYNSGHENYTEKLDVVVTFDDEDIGGCYDTMKLLGYVGEPLGLNVL